MEIRSAEVEGQLRKSTRTKSKKEDPNEEKNSENKITGSESAIERERNGERTKIRLLEVQLRKKTRTNDKSKQRRSR